MRPLHLDNRKFPHCIFEVYGHFGWKDSCVSLPYYLLVSKLPSFAPQEDPAPLKESTGLFQVSQGDRANEEKYFSSWQGVRFTQYSPPLVCLVPSTHASEAVSTSVETKLIDFGMERPVKSPATENVKHRYKQAQG